MSFSTSKSAKVTDAVPVEDEGLSTAQEIVPVPLWWGRRKITARWITPAMNQMAVKAKTRAGKK